MTEYRKITRASQALAFVCLIILALLPVYLAHHWLLPMNQWLDPMPFGPGSIDSSQWPPSEAIQWMGIPVSYVPGLFLALVLYNLFKLFRTYASGEFFSATTVALYRKISASAFWFVLSGIIAQSFLSVLLSFNSPTPHISLTLTHNHLLALFGVTLLRLIAWISAAGSELQSENNAFV